MLITSPRPLTSSRCPVERLCAEVLVCFFVQDSEYVGFGDTVTG